jgi:hypothetical protein
VELPAPHVDQLRPCPRRISSARGRAPTGPPPPLAGDVSGRITTANRKRVSLIANPPRLFACRASPRRRRARRCRRFPGREGPGHKCKDLKTFKGFPVKRFLFFEVFQLKLVKSIKNRRKIQKQQTQFCCSLYT